LATRRAARTAGYPRTADPAGRPAPGRCAGFSFWPSHWASSALSRLRRWRTPPATPTAGLRSWSPGCGSQDQHADGAARAPSGRRSRPLAQLAPGGTRRGTGVGQGAGAGLVGGRVVGFLRPGAGVHRPPLAAPDPPPGPRRPPPRGAARRALRADEAAFQPRDRALVAEQRVIVPGDGCPAGGIQGV